MQIAFMPVYSQVPANNIPVDRESVMNNYPMFSLITLNNVYA
jgi:hypothetical protein